MKALFVFFASLSMVMVMHGYRTSYEPRAEGRASIDRFFLHSREDELLSEHMEKQGKFANKRK